ncbi:AraC family transcriptional regulator, partial [Staphylococcus warneri]
MTVLDEVHDYLISHHTKKLKKQEIANALNMTNQELSNVIKYQTPFQSINQYVNDIRLKCALIDILKEHRTVEDIAYQHGFNHY